MSQMWNLWHGCHKKSEGCQHCYVYRRDAEFEKDSNVVHKTASFLTCPSVVTVKDSGRCHQAR